MRFVVFGLTVSSSWGNGHATLWRGLIRALHRRGHRVTFFERDVPYYAEHRDLTALPGGELVLYRSLAEVGPKVQRALAEADVAMVTSFCPDGREATDRVSNSSAGCRVFYDLDTPVTLDRLARGEDVPWFGPRKLTGFDLVLSYTGGKALDLLRERLGAPRVAPLYGHVDPETHRPVPPEDRFRCELSYLGTWAADRQEAVERLLVGPARRLPDRRFRVGGAQYPADFPWTPNLFLVPHVPPEEHPAFFSSSRATLNVTRRVMAELGFCPSGRLFEAAACGVAVLSDPFVGLETFFEPEREILVVRDAQDVVAALLRSDQALQAVARRGRERVLAEHTSDHRALELLSAVETAAAV
jgi:spore maturation protein CgeB